jgi:hypothetical protein
MTGAKAATQLDGKNPWPGLESFEENASAFFYGRDHEAESLLSHVLDAPVTVLYGRSGLGKTSLLRAGLFPLLRDRDFLPVYVRFELEQGAAALTRQLHQSVHSSIRAKVPDAMLPLDKESVWEYLHRADFELWSAQNYLLTPVIVLDQFEELFTLGERVPDLVRVFRNDLGDLIENRIPADLAARIEDDEAVSARLDLRSCNYKLLISLREDFLPEFEGWRRLIPALGRSRMRLLPLRAGDARDAVQKPAGQMMTDALARRVVDIVVGRDIAWNDLDRPDDDLGASDVEPALLSLFCRELNDERKRRGQPQFDEQLVEELKGDILPNYYSSCVGDLPSRVAEFIESKLIIGKFRTSYPLEDAVPSRLTQDELNRLIRSRLLRLEERGGAQWIELTHDVLTGVVREHRDQRRAEKVAAAEAERQVAREREHTAAVLRKRARILVAVLAVTAVIAAAAIVLFVFAYDARNDAIASFRKVFAAQLVLNAQSILASQRAADRGRAIQLLLAAYALAPDLAEGTLLDTVIAERGTLETFDTTQRASAAAFSLDGQRVVAGTEDGTVQVWHVVSGQPIGVPLPVPLPGHPSPVASVALSPDGRRIASGSVDGALRLWDADTGRPLGAPLIGHTGAVTSVVFSPDGRHIVSGSLDKTVRLWDAARGQPVGQPITGNTAAVLSVAFSPDEQRILSSGEDGVVRAWPGPATWQQELCAKLTTNMSHKQWDEWVSPSIPYVAVCPGLPIPANG